MCSIILKKKLFPILFFSLLFTNIAFAQKSEPCTINACKTTERIKIDGKLNETAWQEAPRISNFTQRDLDFGKPITEKTEAAVIYDKNTLYIGVWCYQKDASTIVAKNMNRDFDYESDDNFQIIISPFDDNRNGYLFVINPNGARADAQVYGGEDGNEDWNGVWDVKTTRNDQGWFAEIYIPFNTIQFKKDSVLNWAINFERDIVSENEQALWQGWSRDNSIYAVNQAGKLLGLTGIAYAKKFEFKPYLLSGRQFDQATGTSYPIKIGGDLNVNISPTLKLNLTSFTDFAQVETDRIPVNLTRFSVYYPEKRQFFLEGYDMYSFYLGEMNEAFYTRVIGAEKGRQVPIIAGVRLFGKEGKHNIGFLNIQEARLDSIPTTNNTVFRYKYDIGKQSYVGAIITNKINQQGSNQVVGLDAAYKTSEFLKNKNLEVKATIATSLQDLSLQQQAFTYRFYIDYPNDFIDNFMAVGSMQKDFNPELGYIHRTNYDAYTWYFRLMPRILNKYGVKRLLLKPWSFTFYKTHNTGEMESFNNESRPIGAIFKSGERFEFNLIQNFDRIDETFSLTDQLHIPVGKYWMYQYEFQFETYNARRIYTELAYNWGDFYTGKIQTFEATLGININKHTNINGAYTLNRLEFPDGLLTTNEVALYFNYAFTTKLNFSLFSQYNDLDQVMLYNIRLHWIPKIGSDLYAVYNIGYIEPIKQVEYLKPQTTDAAVKLVYRFVF